MALDNFKATRVWFARGGSVSAVSLAESGPVRRASNESSEAWPWVDLRVASDVFDSTLVLTRERAVNAGDGGMAEIGAFIAAEIAGWHDELDGQVVTALASAPETQGAFDAAHVAAAVAALNRQTIGKMTLGSSSRPWALAGDNRQALVRGLLPTSDSDQAALLGGAAFSSAVDADTLILVHSDVQPCAIGHLAGGDLVPRPMFGRSAGVSVPGSQDRVISPAGVRVQFDASPVKAVHVGPPPASGAPDTGIVGAVRLTETPPSE